MTESGKRQIRKTAEWFKDKKIDEIYSSPLERCTETAQIIKNRLSDQGQNVSIKTMKALREMGVGRWDNLTFEEIRKRYPREYEERGRCLGYYAPPGGESFYQAGIRFGRVFDEIRKQSDGNILLVAHAGVIRGYLCGLLGISANDVFTIPQPYAGITVLTETDGKLTIQKMGWKPSDFLDQEEIRYLYCKCNTPEAVIRHMEAVAGYVDVLKNGLVLESFDWDALRKAALIHDICRRERRHAKAGADVLRKEGYEEAAVLVAGHHSDRMNSQTDSSERFKLSEEEVLFYADKRVLEDQVTSAETRFKASFEKCTTPEAREKHRRLYEKTKYIEEKIRHLRGGKVI